MSVFNDLRTMHNKFGMERLEKVNFLDEEYMEFRLNFLKEELEETIRSVSEKDLEETIDGLIDLIYVAVGTLDLMGANSQLHWDEVHQCNMCKERGVSKRKFGIDLVKPANWIPPNHRRIIENE